MLQFLLQKCLGFFEQQKISLLMTLESHPKSCSQTFLMEDRRVQRQKRNLAGVSLSTYRLRNFSAVRFGNKCALQNRI